MLKNKNNKNKRKLNNSFSYDTSLPIYFYKEQLINSIKLYQTTIIIGETGSGKSTQLPQYLNDFFDESFNENLELNKEEEKREENSGKTKQNSEEIRQNPGKNKVKIGENRERLGENRIENKKINKKCIVCTQPRRVAAITIAERVSYERNCIIGNEVGYSIRFNDCTGPLTTIKYVTDGVLLREIMTDPNLEKYSVVILDEAHERSLQTDILMGLLKQLQQTKPSLRFLNIFILFYILYIFFFF